MGTLTIEQMRTAYLDATIPIPLGMGMLFISVQETRAALMRQGKTDAEADQMVAAVRSAASEMIVIRPGVPRPDLEGQRLDTFLESLRNLLNVSLVPGKGGKGGARPKIPDRLLPRYYAYAREDARAVIAYQRSGVSFEEFRDDPKYARVAARVDQLRQRLPRLFEFRSRERDEKQLAVEILHQDFPHVTKKALNAALARCGK